MRTLKIALGIALSVAGSAQAAMLHFQGNLTAHNQVLYTRFTLDQAMPTVRMWTDSFRNGTNFDPITALWNASTGARIAENDDNASIDPATQTYYDSGFKVENLAAGNYVFTVATYRNFALGSNLSDGFAYGNETPQPLSTWCQPASHCNMGTYWSVRLDGVSSASNDASQPSGNVPVPGSASLILAALAGLSLVRRQHRA